MPYRDAGAGPLGCARHPFTVGEHPCSECGARACLACTSFAAMRVRCVACADARRRRAAFMQAVVLLAAGSLALVAPALIHQDTDPAPARSSPVAAVAVAAYVPRERGADHRRCCRCLGCWRCAPRSIINAQPSAWRQPPAPHPLAAFAKPSRPIF